LLLLPSCVIDDDSEIIKKSEFSEPEEFISNPSITAAVTESGFSINLGENPPPLAGTYLTNGEVVDASTIVNDLIGMPINSEIKLYNQTVSGKIDFQEKLGEITAWGSGGYITGENGKFTIWQESEQSGEEAGLPDDITINVALLMSGTKLNNGDLTAKGISIVTEVVTTNSQYDVESIEKIWWMWDAYFELQAANIKKGSADYENLGFSLTIQKEIIKAFLEDSKLR